MHPGGDEDVFFVDVTDATYRRHACKFGHNYGALTSGRFDLQGDTDAPLFSCVAGFELLSDSANQALQKSGLHKLNTVKFLPESYSGYQKPIWAIHPANPFVIDRDLVIAGKAPE